jgi:prepilin-type N-terminal cleavage/methylation domain-containing protein
MKNIKNALCGCARAYGYSLMEVMAASSVIAIALGALASMAGTMNMQEEAAWRAAIVRNHQENMVRLWQLGLTPAEVNSIMPDPATNPELSRCFFSSPELTETSDHTINSSLGSMEKAVCEVTINATLNSGGKTAGALCRQTVYRAKLPTLLRPPAVATPAN